MKGVAQILSDTTAVTDLVGDRIFFSDREQGSGLPAITMRITNNEPSRTKSGASTLDTDTVQIICFANTVYGSSGAETVAEAVRDALDRVTPGTYNGEAIQAIDFLDRFTDFEEINNKKIHYVEQNYQVRIER